VVVDLGRKGLAPTYITGTNCLFRASHTQRNARWWVRAWGGSTAWTLAFSGDLATLGREGAERWCGEGGWWGGVAGKASRTHQSGWAASLVLVWRGLISSTCVETPRSSMP